MNAPLDDLETLDAGNGLTGDFDARPPGEVFGDHELLEKIGEGGMGVVYKARHLKLNRVVALKLISTGRHGRQSDRDRFRIEAEAAARLSHPGIAQVYDVGEVDCIPYLSLEYCPGGSLAARLAGDPFPPRQAAEVTRQLAAAVQEAHDHQVLHRDLKPANVLLAADGTIKLADFGLAKRLDEVQGITVSRSILGSPAYMSPEQATGWSPGQSADGRRVRSGGHPV